jgi:hypothetical protein
VKRPREYTDAELVAGSLAIWLLGLIIAATLVSLRYL